MIAGGKHKLNGDTHRADSCGGGSSNNHDSFGVTMETDFWLEKWNRNEIAFHQSEVNSMLVDHIGALALPSGGRVFVPLCGKTLDIAWLLSRGFRVAGIELSELAIQSLFAELGVTPDVTRSGKLKRYSAPDIDIFVGDLFDLSTDILGAVDAVYDRAALVALPADLRGRYASHVAEVTAGSPYLLICFEYDQSVMPGPPFSIDEEEVARLFAGQYGLSSLAGADVSGGLKGICPALETAWMLRS